MRKPDLLSRRRQNLEEQLPTLLSNKECQELVRLGWEKADKKCHMYLMYLFTVQYLDYLIHVKKVRTYIHIIHVGMCMCVSVESIN